jgi:3',5'-cyclic AMP phosphodiesterase CpdA
MRAARRSSAGYFEYLLPQLNQASSYFAFQNDYWTLIALGSAYNQDIGGQEGNLDQQQIDWVNAIVAAAGNRKIVLFSHHQPFSQLDPNQGPKLVAALQDGDTRRERGRRSR